MPAADVGPTCHQCGATGCRNLFDHLLALEFERPDPYGRLHALTVPAWFLQHPDDALAGTRADHWAVLQRWRRDGLDGVDLVIRRRRAANGRGQDLPPAMDEPFPPVPDRVGTTVTIADVAGPGRDFPVTGHADRIATWIAAIIAA